MTDSPTTAPTSRRVRLRMRRARAWLIFLPGVVMVAVTIAVAAGMFAGGGEQPVVIEQGGIEWRSVDVRRTDAGSGFTIRARVADDRLAGDAATPSSPYVLWMLGSGRYDDRPHVDSRRDEAALGMSHDDEVQIHPVGRGMQSLDLIDSGTYSPSVDGTITYREIPAGEYRLRALVLQPDGSWDGTLAVRTIRVE